MVAVTGFKECVEVLLNTEDFSSVNSPVPTQSLPFEPVGDDISEQIEAHRDQFARGDILVSADGARHANFRALTTVLFTPSRLKENEAYMAELSDKLVRDAVAKGGCELVREMAVPYVTMVIADLLGIPEEDRERSASRSMPAPLSLALSRILGSNGRSSHGSSCARILRVTSQIAGRTRAMTC